MTRLTLSLPPGYAPVPGADRTPATSSLFGDGVDAAAVDALLDALAVASAARGVVTSGVLALDGTSTAWLTVAVTTLEGEAPDVGRTVQGVADLLRERYPAADVRTVALPAGPAVRVEQRGHLSPPGGEGELVDVRHLLPSPGGRDVVTLVLQGRGTDPVLLGDAADRLARGLRFGDGDT